MRQQTILVVFCLPEGKGTTVGNEVREYVVMYQLLNVMHHIEIFHIKKYFKAAVDPHNNTSECSKNQWWKK